jgi:hypothetical protein
MLQNSTPLLPPLLLPLLLLLLLLLLLQGLPEHIRARVCCCQLLYSRASPGVSVGGH